MEGRGESGGEEGKRGWREEKKDKRREKGRGIERKRKDGGRGGGRKERRRSKQGRLPLPLRTCHTASFSGSPLLWWAEIVPESHPTSMQALPTAYRHLFPCIKSFLLKIEGWFLCLH